MKKLISILAFASAVTLSAALFTACGDNKNSSSEANADLSSQADSKEEVKNDPVEEEAEESSEVPKMSTIIGTWKSDDGVSYTFNEDGTGIYNNGEEDSEFTYTEKNFGITITPGNGDDPLKYDYVAAGTQLILKDKNESNEEFVFQKQ